MILILKITKENVEKFTGTGNNVQKKGGRIYTYGNNGFDVEESIGEDLEDLFERIKKGEVVKYETFIKGVPRVIWPNRPVLKGRYIFTG